MHPYDDDRVLNKAQSAFILGVEVDQLEELVQRREISFLPDWSGRNRLLFSFFDLTSFLDDIEQDLLDAERERLDTIQ